MSDVYFVRMNEMRDGYYDGYRDYFTLAELAGYPVIWFEELDPESDNTYILSPLNGTWNNGWQNPKARVILWDIEWRLETGGHEWGKSLLVTPPGVSEVWASDRWYANIIGAKYVPLGSHPGLVQEHRPALDTFDTTLQSYMSGRRTYMADRLMEKGLSIAPARWNPDRDALLKSTTAMLHIHQWGEIGERASIATIAPLRYAIAAAYGLPLISETVIDRDIFTDEVVLMCDYNAMPEYVSTMVRRYPEELKARGQALKELLCEQYSFRKCVERAL